MQIKHAMILAIALTLSGCAMRHVEVRTVIPPDCISEMKPGPEGCIVRENGKAVCPDAQITRTAGCERVVVNQKGKK